MGFLCSCTCVCFRWGEGMLFSISPLIFRFEHIRTLSLTVNVFRLTPSADPSRFQACLHPARSWHVLCDGIACIVEESSEFVHRTRDYVGIQLLRKANWFTYAYVAAAVPSVLTPAELRDNRRCKRNIFFSENDAYAPQEEEEFAKPAQTQSWFLVFLPSKILISSGVTPIFSIFGKISINLCCECNHQRVVFVSSVFWWMAWRTEQCVGLFIVLIPSSRKRVSITSFPAASLPHCFSMSTSRYASTICREKFSNLFKRQKHQAENCINKKNKVSVKIGWVFSASDNC